ncbi:hypothetical protein BDF20DRAFT_904685 [Mycotypha africana]|uniref:uncharacterized protein n=1 Tax=Mycotypha africana TaxID=64632 RepID=UPI00230141ED|nr:uncharacterized protein BDF20DRAFT_904685 [Mycotypha africana]KAI8987715.1 hypothetical protein BDF20DRAFT_904685 [Mycotypha africana]
MSHQSGIQVSEELSKAFTDAVSNGNVRVIRVSIDNDYKSYVSDYLETTTPAYIFVRLDERTTSTGEYKWLFLCYVPDNAKVRDKMLYASTRATLTKELGDYRFVDNIYGTEKAEFTWEGYKRHLAHKAAEAPLTRREQELAEIKAEEAKTVSSYQGTSTRKSYAPGVAFPLTEKAIEALCSLQAEKEHRSHNFVSLCLDNERIDLVDVQNIGIDDLSKTISQNSPRFTFYNYDNGAEETIVFIYTCPSQSKIRERMLYSSSKSNVIAAAENNASIHVCKKFETSDLEDLTKAYFEEELKIGASKSSGFDSPHSTGSIVGNRIQMLGGARQGFKRPVAPGRRRPASTNSANSNTTSSLS